MKKYIYPDTQAWKKLIERPVIDEEQLTEAVSTIIHDVKLKGDQALFNYSREFDGVELTHLSVVNDELAKAGALVSNTLKMAINTAYQNIAKFHQAQQKKEETVETTPGVKCWRKSVPIEKVGLYIPGGSAPLFSTILMLAIPANIAGCSEIILCTPPNKKGTIHPAILYTAQLVGISKIYKVGGAQAIAAMALGTATIPQVFKIFGPGNQYVTKAKELVQQEGIAIDMPAGPSEVLVIADKTCNPRFVAADLLSQAEHGADSQVILLTDDEETLTACLSEVSIQLDDLPRKELAIKALSHSKAILLKNRIACITWSNLYAPEHLIIASKDARSYVDDIVNAGSVFLGNYSCESAGDYASGTNHTLPTNGYARSYSGVSLESFVKKITYQELSREGLKNIGKAIEVMAEAEALFAHKNAVSIRLEDMENNEVT